MRARWANLTKSNRVAFRAAIAFLEGRLENRETVEWALKLKPNDTIKRLALLDLIDSPRGRKLNEPWRSAWHLIKESWNNPAIEDHVSTGIYHVRDRLRAGERSRSLVTTIVELVAPRIKIDSFSELHFEKPSKKPKKVEDLFSMRLTSGKIIDLEILRIGDIDDQPFLLSLALALESAITNGLDIARCIGWKAESHSWKLGQLHRVNYVPATERMDGRNEPDEFNRGIAPSVKLLSAVVSRLADIDISTAIEFVRRWKVMNLPIHLRLWAALSRDCRITPANEVAAFLISLDKRRFWDLNDYPEIAELRAKRFNEFDPREQATLMARIRKRPPRNQWPRDADADRVESARLYWAVRELRRIEIAGASLPKRDKTWLYKHIGKFPDLIQMTRFDTGFLDSPIVRWIPPNPDNRYDLLAGEARLKALEAALSSISGRWDDDAAKRASDWIQQSENSTQVLVDFESVPSGGAAFVRAWDLFGRTHSPVIAQGRGVAQRDLSMESVRVLSLLAKLPENTVRQAIDGICHWLSSWKKQITVQPEGPSVWLKFWPIAVEVTNTAQSVDEENRISTFAQSSDDREPINLDTLNTPAGKLVGVFLAMCPDLQVNDHPFNRSSVLHLMRDTIIAATGRSGLIVRYRMIEQLLYFLKADEAWAHEYLITPLLTAENLEIKILWNAIARQTRFQDVLKIIGNQMADRAADQSLSRETRRSLVFSLVIECLYAFHEKREPAIPRARIEQMIRLLDDEVRVYGAEAVRRFVRDVSTSSRGEQPSASPEDLFRSAAAPFLQGVWPQERALASPGVSRALAQLPATTPGAFVEAVNTIERFLVPFECWSMLDYGLFGEEDDNPKLSIIDNDAKAVAFLRLLDLTIGKAEGAVIPDDLSDALDQIRKVAEKIAEDPVFRRLSTLARRG